MRVESRCACRRSVGPGRATCAGLEAGRIPPRGTVAGLRAAEGDGFVHRLLASRE